MRAAIAAGIGLGMKSSVFWVVILSLAKGAHYKVLHRGLGPVIGDINDDSIAGSAVSAVDERVLKAAVIEIK